MFTKVDVLMRHRDTGKELPIEAVINLNEIVSVLSHHDGDSSSVLMSTGDKLLLNVRFAQLCRRLIDLQTHS